MISKMKKEVFSLYLIQISNIAIPLLTFPYFARILGVEGVGKIGFAQTIFMIFGFLIDFGFNLSGARTISIYDQSKKDYSSIYTNIILFKSVIYFFLIFITLVLVQIIDINTIDKNIIFIALIASFGNVIVPNFIFNGLSINSKLAIVTLIVRLLFIIPIFIFVNNSNDFNLAIIFQLIPSIFIGLLAQYYIIKNIDVKFSLRLYQLKACIFHAKDAFDNFSASFFTLGFTYFIPILIKNYLGDYALGIYTMIDKLIGIMRQMYVPLVQAFYAKICVYYEEKKWVDYSKAIRKIILLFASIGIIVWCGNWILGKWVLEIIFGKIQDLSYYLSLAIITQIIISAAILIVNFYILPSKNGYILKRIYAIGFILFFPIFYFFQKKFALSGIFYAMQCIEILITGMLLFFVLYKIKIHNYWNKV